jgi:hypothetical protein
VIECRKGALRGSACDRAPSPFSSPKAKEKGLKPKISDALSLEVEFNKKAISSKHM